MLLVNWLLYIQGGIQIPDPYLNDLVNLTTKPAKFRYSRIYIGCVYLVMGIDQVAQ